jgi:sterol desaturase/sphingolipid hydroxylase (fatty acid hydroxylase superfamily)
MPAAMSLIPIHLVSLVVVSTFLSGSIVLAHCGHDVFPEWWQRIPVLNWYVTPRIHEAHHRRRDCNYSATLSIFDRAFGTLRLDVPRRDRIAPGAPASLTAPRRS